MAMSLFLSQCALTHAPKVLSMPACSPGSHAGSSSLSAANRSSSPRPASPRPASPRGASPLRTGAMPRATSVLRSPSPPPMRTISSTSSADAYSERSYRLAGSELHTKSLVPRWVGRVRAEWKEDPSNVASTAGGHVPALTVRFEAAVAQDIGVDSRRGRNVYGEGRSISGLGLYILLRVTYSRRTRASRV